MVDFLPEVEDNDKDDVEDHGQLDEQALANFRAAEEGKIIDAFQEIDFHPDEPRPPNQYMYSAYFEHLRHTLNTYLKRPIRDQFVTNTKKCVLTVVRNQNRTIEAGYIIKQDVTYHDQAQTLLEDAMNRMFAKDEGSEFTSPLMLELIPLKRGLKGVVKRNRKELEKHA